MGRSTKPHSNWYASTRKLLSFFRVFKNLALIWRHPIATLCILLFLLLLFITPMQTIIRFFSPLIVCTLLCMVAFISFGSLMEKNENQTSHIQVGDQIAALDVLGLGEGWAPYNGFQSHSRFTKDGDLNFLDVKVKSKTYVQTRNEIFGVDQLEEDGDYQSDRSLKKEIGLSFLTDSKTHVQIENDFAGMDGQERQAGWASPIHDGLQSATSKLKLDRSLSSLAEPVMERESKTHVKFEDDIATMDEKGGVEDWASQMHDGLHSDTDRREEDGQITLTEEMNENKNHVQIEDGYSSLTEGMKEDKSLVQVEDASDGSDEQGQDREWDSQMFNGFQQDSNIKPDDGLGSVMDTNEIETEIQTEEAAGMDVVSDFDQEFYDTNEFHDSNFTHEDDPNQEAGSEVQMEDQINGLAVLDHDPNLAVQLYNVSQADGNPKHESELKQKIDSEVQLEDKINGVDVLGHDPNLAIELFDGSQSDSNPKHESEFMQEIDSEIQMGDKINAMDVLGHDPNLAVELYNENPKHESEFKQEIDSEMQIGDKINGMDVLGHDENLAAELDHELHSCNNLKQADDPNQVPQKWRDWVRGVETDGLSIWTSEKDIFKNADESTMCTNFGQEITGTTTLEEEYTSNEAFIAVDENEGVLLEELSAFIQGLTLKLQSFQVEAGQARGINESADQKDTNPACSVSQATGLKFAGFSPRIENVDDSNTEEGDASSRWDEALDTSEKESADSENEEERIWPLASDVSELGATMTEKEFNNLKQEYSALEKEYKALQHEIRSKASGQKAGTLTGENDEDSDDSLDPYVQLFAQCASDAEDEVSDLHHHAEQHRDLKTSKIEKSRATTVRERSLLDTKRLFRKPMLCCIGRAMRAIKGKKL